MRVVHLNTVDSTGGAAKAMSRLHESLVDAGFDSSMVVGGKKTTSDRVFGVHEIARPFRRLRDKIIDRAGQNLAGRIGAEALPHRNSKLLWRSEIFRSADIIHLHNLHGGYFNFGALNAIPREKPIVWTMHDMNSFTGHCAHSGKCEKYIDGCDETCPIPDDYPALKPFLISRRWTLLKRFITDRKKLIGAAPSEWLAGRAKRGSWRFAQTATIPNGVDLNIFSPIHKEEARKAVGIHGFKHYILFGSNRLADKNKGVDYLSSALSQYLAGRESKDVCLIAFGEGSFERDTGLGGAKVFNMGRIENDRLLRVVYSSADILVFPSLADNLPFVVMESMACGTPVVAFEIGGVPELAAHMSTGYLAGYKDVNDLAKGIETLLGNAGLRENLIVNGLKKIKDRFSLTAMRDAYIGIYRELSRSGGKS